MRLPLGTKIFLGTALVVTLVLGAALLVTKRQADRAADAASLQAVQATQAAIRDALEGRSQTLLQLTAAAPASASRCGPVSGRTCSTRLTSSESKSAQSGS